MDTILFFLLGLIAGGLLCRRGPEGACGPMGPPGLQGPRGRDGKDSVDHDDYAEPWHQCVTGPRPHTRSLREILEGINNKVDQLRIVAQFTLDREGRETRRHLMARLEREAAGPLTEPNKDNPS